MGHGSYGSWVKYSVGHMGHGWLKVTHRLPCLLVSSCPWTSHLKSAAVHFFLAPGWSWALSEDCEMPEALHTVHNKCIRDDTKAAEVKA